MPASNAQLTDKWSVGYLPQGQNPGQLQKKGVAAPTPENIGGMVIYLVNNRTGTKEEVSRVAFVRRAGTNPRVSFDKAFQKEIAKAQTAAAALNQQATTQEGALSQIRGEEGSLR